MAESHPIPNHPLFKNLSGRTFGRLTVVSYAGPTGKGSHWHCVCECGRERLVSTSLLNRNSAKECEECRSPTVQPATKRCRRCKTVLPFTLEFFAANNQHKFNLEAICRTCSNGIARIDAKKSAVALRLEILSHYSNGNPCCACCGEVTFDFLALDHLAGSSREDYAKHRTAVRFFLSIRRNGFPPNFRVLCHNCNSSIGHYGYCPHEAGKERAFADLMTSKAATPSRKTRRLKHLTLSRYSTGLFPECACCQETALEFLCIDHIHGGGGKHARSIKGPLYRELKRQGFPPGYRVLCCNCNQSSGYYGTCPHNRKAL